MKEAQANTAPPTLAEVIQGVLSRKAKTGRSSYSQSIYNVKDAANMLNFLTANSIKDMAGLEEKVVDMYGEQRSISEKLKPIDRRLKTLDEHLKNTEKYLKYRSIYRQYKQQKPQKRASFYETYRMELTHYEAAERYLKGIMNGRRTLPIKTWEAEYNKLKTERQQLSYRYFALKDEVKEIEQIRRNIYSILKEESRSEQPTCKHDMEQ